MKQLISNKTKFDSNKRVTVTSPSSLISPPILHIRLFLKLEEFKNCRAFHSNSCFSEQTQMSWILRLTEKIHRLSGTGLNNIIRLSAALKAFDRFAIIRNFCSLRLVCWIIVQLWCNVTKTIWSWKPWAVDTGVGIPLQVSCCRIASVITNPQYSQVPETRDDMEGLQGQDIDSEDIGSIWIKLTQGDSVMQGPASLVVRVRTWHTAQDEETGRDEQGLTVERDLLYGARPRGCMCTLNTSIT